jgi:hypothetical protein
LYRFVEAINEMYGYEYLRRPNANELKQILLDNANRGFPGCIGSLDCTHWAWKNCPVSLAGTYKGKEKYPTIVLEAVATQDWRFWHVFFGTPGSLNDLNLLDKSDLLEDTLHKKSPQISFKINGNHYNYGYYLVDGIYNNYATMIKGNLTSTDKALRNFTKAQEGARKDIECAFGHLKGRFQIIERPGRSWSQKRMEETIYCCVILQNMLIEEKKEDRPLPRTLPFNTVVTPPNPNQPWLSQTEIQFWKMDMNSELQHAYLTEDLIKLHWKLRGRDPGNKDGDTSNSDTQIS